MRAFALVAAVDDLLGRAGLAADDIAGDVGSSCAVPFSTTSRIRRRIWSEVRAEMTRVPAGGGASSSRRRRVTGRSVPPLTTAAVAGDELQRRDRDAVAEGDGHRVDLAPRRRDQRGADLRQLDRRRLQEAEAPEEFALAVAADVERHAHRADVGRVHEDLGHRQPALLALVVGDREARDLDRLGGVVPVGHRRGAGVERHRRVEDLEGRAQLVDAERVAVEARLRLGLAGRVRIEIGQRHHRQQFAGVDVEHHRGAADGAEFLDRGEQLLADEVLDADVERQPQRVDRLLQAVVEILLDAGEAALVDVGEADDMRGRAARADRRGAPRAGRTGRGCRGG